MAGKKGKKSGRKSGRKSSRGRKDDKDRQQGDQLTELDKEWYHIQIRDLEAKLDRTREKCSQLESSNKEYRDQFDQLTEDKADVVAFLKKTLQTKSEESQELRGRLAGLQQNRDSEKEGFEKEIERLKNEYHVMKEQLTSENLLLGGKLSSLEEFRLQKEDLLSKFAELEEKLQEQEREQMRTVYDLERKNITDQNRLKKEMVERVSQVAADFRTAAHTQMAATTQRTIRENVTIGAQLRNLSARAARLTTDNDWLEGKDWRARVKMEMLQAEKQDLLKRAACRQKVIDVLTQRCHDREARLQQYLDLKSESDVLETDMQQAQQQIATATRELQELEKVNRQKEKVVAELQKTLQEEHRKREYIEKILKGVADVVKEAITLENARPGSHDPGIRQLKREELMSHLLLLLNVANMHKDETTGTQHKGQSHSRRRSITPRQELPSIHNKPRRSSSASYSMGNLGLVPKTSKYNSA